MIDLFMPFAARKDSIVGMECKCISSAFMCHYWQGTEHEIPDG